VTADHTNDDHYRQMTATDTVLRCEKATLLFCF